MKKDISHDSAHGYRTDLTTVIGHFPNYQMVAEELGAQCFCIAPSELLALTSEELWRRNRAFLEDNIVAGGQFVLATAPEAAKPGSWFEKELAFLIGQGAKLVPMPAPQRCVSAN